MGYEQLKLDNQLCFPFYAVSRLITRAYQEDLDAMGITYPQYLVLMILWEKDGVTVNEIAEKLILNTNTVTPLLKRMEFMGLVERIQSKTDQRKVIVSLTEKAVLLEQEAACVPKKLVERLDLSATDLSLAELGALRERLKQLLGVLASATELNK
ncbi:MAG: MarR family transcriptional regulator [Paludibacter sp.]|nr:MarR family transcriptional regulator [Paludibacter sp.]